MMNSDRRHDFRAMLDNRALLRLAKDLTFPARVHNLSNTGAKLVCPARYALLVCPAGVGHQPDPSRLVDLSIALKVQDKLFDITLRVCAIYCHSARDNQLALGMKIIAIDDESRGNLAWFIDRRLNSEVLFHTPKVGSVRV